MIGEQLLKRLLLRRQPPEVRRKSAYLTSSQRIAFVWLDSDHCTIHLRMEDGSELSFQCLLNGRLGEPTLEARRSM